MQFAKQDPQASVCMEARLGEVWTQHQVRFLQALQGLLGVEKQESWTRCPLNAQEANWQCACQGAKRMGARVQPLPPKVAAATQLESHSSAVVRG